MNLQTEEILATGKHYNAHEVDTILAEILNADTRQQVHQLIAGTFTHGYERENAVVLPPHVLEKNSVTPFYGVKGYFSPSVELGAQESCREVLHYHREDVEYDSSIFTIRQSTFIVKAHPGDYLGEFEWKRIRGADEATNEHRKVTRPENRGRGFGAILQRLSEDFYFRVQQVRKLIVKTHQPGAASFFMRNGFMIREHFLRYEILSEVLNWDGSTYRGDFPVRIELEKQNPALSDHLEPQ